MALFRRLVRAAALAALVVAVALFGVAFGARWHDGPIGPFAGGPLVAGEVVSAPVTDWSFAASIQTLELEVSPDAPRSVTTWFLVVDGALHIPLGPAARTWPDLAQQDPRVRVRIDGVIYELAAARVDDPAIAKRVAEAVREKYPFGNAERIEGAGAFALAPRM